MVSVKIRKDNVAAVLKGIASLARQDVLVGIPGTEGDHAGEDGRPVTKAELGYIHENGSPASNIPARPFLLPGVRDVQDKTINDFRAAATAALNGNSEKVLSAMSRAGERAAQSAKSVMTNSAYTPLKPGTIANRWRSRNTASRRKGEKQYMDMIASGAQAAGMSLSDIEAAAGIQPLINTGELRNSITYVIRKK
ncbi:hypothetical protein [Silvimonas soli]|uniref:hypothetical protein n=1 Tax=Silvimonas soli TaxID=2980100 RepID=UPI0024B33832|nr:hypothetical protein [Silvimonas soli]